GAFSTIVRALGAGVWRDGALPASASSSVIAATASGSIGVVAAWSRYAVTPSSLGSADAGERRGRPRGRKAQDGQRLNRRTGHARHLAPHTRPRPGSAPPTPRP